MGLSTTIKRPPNGANALGKDRKPLPVSKLVLKAQAELGARAINIHIFNSISVSKDMHELSTIDSCDPEPQAIRSLCGLPVIDVLWLSPMVFISCMALQLESTPLVDFQVKSTDENFKFIFHVYSLSDFGHGPRIPCSTLPIAFCCHLIALLPANYFPYIDFSCFDFFLRFLSIIPHDAPQSPPRHAKEPWTVFALRLGEKMISREDLCAIFSHKFHPAVKLSFYDFGFNESCWEISTTTQEKCFTQLKSN
jgi:hypothetical protein